MAGLENTSFFLTLTPGQVSEKGHYVCVCVCGGGALMHDL